MTGTTWSEARATVLGTYLVVLLVELITTSQIVGAAATDLASPRMLAALAGTVVVTGCFLRVHTAVLHRRHDRETVVLVLLVVVLSLLLTTFMGSWMLACFALAAVLLTLPVPRSLMAAGALAVGFGLALAVGTDNSVSFFAVVGIPLTTLTVGYVLYVMTRLVLVHQELRQARERLARIRVDEDRLRISRELHDILGRTLVTASLRNETAQLLLGTDVEAARAQLEELRTTVLDGQTKLRSLTSGPAIVGLEHELEAAADTFAQLGVRCTVEGGPVGDSVANPLLAAVVRETVTNMLKHSRPSECRIAIREESLATVLTVVNDGAPPHTASTGGTGLEYLASQVRAVDGTLTAGLIPDHRYRVIVRIPRRSIVVPSFRSESL